VSQSVTFHSQTSKVNKEPQSLSTEKYCVRGTRPSQNPVNQRTSSAIPETVRVIVDQANSVKLQPVSQGSTPARHSASTPHGRARGRNCGKNNWFAAWLSGGGLKEIGQTSPCSLQTSWLCVVLWQIINHNF